MAGVTSQACTQQRVGGVMKANVPLSSKSGLKRSSLISGALKQKENFTMIAFLMGIFYGIIEAP